jgi:hypothetical protein
MIPALEKVREEDCKLQASSTESSRPVWDLRPVSKNEKDKMVLCL